MIIRKKKKKRRLTGYRKWEADAARSAKTLSVGSALFQLFERMGISEKVEQQRAVLIWSETVGPEIAIMTNAVSIRNGVLRVVVANSSWRHTLIFMKEDITYKLNKTLGKSIVDDILFS
ncbi:DUF721 domain-containing protein [bacterium]|nr:DUF721 domain-containing protein [bacterium]